MNIWHLVIIACFILIIIFSGCIGSNKALSKVEVPVSSMADASVLDGYRPLFGQIEGFMGMGKLVQQISDGEYIVSGDSTEGWGGFVLLLKMNISGNATWVKRISLGELLQNGIWKSSFEHVRSAQQTNDGGFLISASRDGFTGELNKWLPNGLILIKTDANGNMEWERAFSEEGDYFGSIQPTNDGGYILTGYTTPDQYSYENVNLILVKTDSNGNIIWKKTFGVVGLLTGGQLAKQTVDNDYIIMGKKIHMDASIGSDSVWLIKTDSNGNKVWDKTFGCGNFSGGNDLLETIDGGYILTGRNCNGVFVTKVDAIGNIVWERSFFGGMATGNSIKQTSDGGYILTGGVTPYNSNSSNAFLIKIDSTGNTMWDKIFAGMTGGYGGNVGYSVQQTNDGGYIITGVTEFYKKAGVGDSGILLIKTNSKGDEEWGYYHHPVSAQKQV